MCQKSWTAIEAHLPGCRSDVYSDLATILSAWVSRKCAGRCPPCPLRKRRWPRARGGHRPGHHRGKTVLDNVLDPAEVKLLSTRCAFVFCNLQIPRRLILFESNRRSWRDTLPAL